MGDNGTELEVDEWMKDFSVERVGGTSFLVIPSSYDEESGELHAHALSINVAHIQHFTLLAIPPTDRQLELVFVRGHVAHARFAIPQNAKTDLRDITRHLAHISE